MLKTINKAILSTEHISGDIVFFRAYKGDNVIRILKSDITHKHILIVHNSTGLEEPTQYDMEKDGKACLYKKGRFLFGKRDLVSRLDSNLKNIKGRYTISDHKTTQIAVEKLKNISPSLCVIDLIQYEPTKTALAYCFDKIPMGGCIIITNYVENAQLLSSKAVNDFVLDNCTKITISINTIEKTATISKTIPTVTSLIPITYNFKKPATPIQTDLIICCVLRTGGTVYDHNYVNALANAVKRNVTVPHEFVCLTNDPTGFNSNVDSVIEFKHDFKKWWGKIELFRPDIFIGKRVFFLDLDTVIVGNIDHIVDRPFNFAGLEDFYKTSTLGSGLMSWTQGKYSHIYERFLRNSRQIMDTTPEGDQRWIMQNISDITYLQKVFGNDIISYKKHCIKHKIFLMQKNAKIVCFHGIPKPHEINYPAIKDHWLP